MPQNTAKTLIIEGGYGDINLSNMVKMIIGSIFDAGWAVTNFSLDLNAGPGKWQLTLQIAPLEFKNPVSSDVSIARLDFERLKKELEGLTDITDVRED